MPNDDNEQRVKEFFGLIRPMYARLVATLVDDAETVMAEAEKLFTDMIPDMAYVDQPEHPMANSVFGCSAALAVFLVLRKLDVSEHAFGRAMLDALAKRPAPAPPDDEQAMQDTFDRMAKTADASQRNAKPGEFIFEVYRGDGGTHDWGMNIKSCAICHAFARHDAMSLVPYMCASDDVMSDAGNQGLRRTGTIAVGAHQCDFVYQRGGEPLHLADLYPERIRVVD